jgi:alpha-2-macroglobulin
MTRLSGLFAAVLLALATALPARSQTTPAVPPQLDRLARADGAHVVPDHFLRRWDPVTILFDAPTGPDAGGPEDNPARLVTLSPPKPGSWTWLGPKTLQFRPVEPWEPLRRESVTVAGATTTLVPLLPVPSSVGPSDADNGIAGLDTLALTFDQPVDLAALARLLTIDISPQTGSGETGAQTLIAQDFDLRPMERAARKDQQTIMVVLKRPLPDGRVAKLRLLLSDEPGLDDPIFSMTLRSATPFLPSGTVCGDSFGLTFQDGATRCEPFASLVAQPRRVVLQFSALPEALDIVRARDIVRITPPLDDLDVKSTDNDELRIGGKFEADKVYRISIAAGALHDRTGRPLASAVEANVSFGAGTPALAWDAQQGIVERLGPQMVPLRGHGYDHADLRIYPIDPLSADFWPFPRNGLVTDDDHAPPLPGNEPAHYTGDRPISVDAMARRIAALGSPAISEMMSLPIHSGGVDAKFGLDLAPSLAKIAGPQAPGAYLVGLRTVDGSVRQWARLQVTDLSLAAVEEAEHVRFVATSLADAKPVEGAEIHLDGLRDGKFVTLAQGVTGADGSWTMAAPLARGLDRKPAEIERITVVKATDTLVLEPRRGPQEYANGNWTRPETPWLQWTTRDLAPRQEKPVTLCHVFTERPIYRPEEPILIAGMIRRGYQGGLSYATGSGEVVIKAPGDQEWRLPVTLDEIGGFHVKFAEKTEPTGDYSIQYQPKDGEPCGAITVKKEAYRLPTFEVVLNGPATAPLDAPFHVDLLARFFAGGMLSDRPITWRVTQFPYVWTPPGRDGFLFSSDSRFAGDSPFRSTPVMNRDAKTDAGGSAQLTLDPTIEPTAQPRQYVVEATVTGDDDLQVRSTQHVIALPPFVLGVKVPRYLPQTGAIDPEVVALDGSGHEVSGLAMTVKLIHRQWNSVLQASDFAQGSAKYQTQVIDETVAERQVTSGDAAQSVHFGASEAGVYLVEVTAADKVGRTQTVRVDLFMSGDTPVTWQRPPAQIVTVSTDKDRYDPGETATLLIQSPFQTASALAIVEEPEGRFRYDWVDIANGQGRYAVPIRKQQMPRLAVHFLLMRGRLPAALPPNAPFDQGKPVSLAATAWVRVNPTDNIVKVSFDAPAQARPEQEFDLVLHLSDPAGHPLSGEATVWMVDQAVLSLAKEQPLDPLPAFVVDRPSRMALRDSRNMAFGVLPLIENPGGDEAGDFGMENISVRKNFTPVPLYEPRVKVGPDGTARIHVKLPDTLTVYMLRAKAVSGPDRFGYGAGQIRIRQPIVAQPALPRFVRPGDSFSAGVIGRIVEGPGGAGRAAIAAQNLMVTGPAAQDFAWDDQRPARTDFSVTVPEPAAGVTSAQIRLTVQRGSDHVGDAVQIDLPIKPDRPAIHRRDVLAVGADGALDIPPLADPARPASYSDTLTLATDPAAVKLLAGVNFLTRPLVGGVEQRLALARGELALMPFTPLLDAAGLRARVAGDIAAAIASVKLSTDDDGLVAFFPHNRGSVWLTASAFRVLVQAERLGVAVDKPTEERMAKVLTAALRSDYPHLLTGEELFDRVAALAALADGGRISADYTAELARQAQALRTGAMADVATVLARLPKGDPRLLDLVLTAMWERVNLLSRDGKPVYAGLVDQPATPAILPSEARSLAEVTRAAATASPDDLRTPLVRLALLGMADGQGWGTTNATAAALEALAAAWQAPGVAISAVVGLPDGPANATLDAAHPLFQATTNKPGPIHVQAKPGVAVLQSVDYVPVEPGAVARADQHGFVLTRTLMRVPPMQGAVQPPMEKLEPGPDGAIHLTVGDVVEEVDELVNPQARDQVALHLPLAAGMEPLNPALATATADAAPSAAPTLAPSWASYGDDEVTAVYLSLQPGAYTLRTRMRASIAGSFTAPPATVDMLYRLGVSGSSAGALVVVSK